MSFVEGLTNEIGLTISFWEYGFLLFLYIWARKFFFTLAHVAYMRDRRGLDGQHALKKQGHSGDVPHLSGTGLLNPSPHPRMGPIRIEDRR